MSTDQDTGEHSLTSMRGHGGQDGPVSGGEAPEGAGAGVSSGGGGVSAGSLHVSVSGQGGTGGRSGSGGSPGRGSRGSRPQRRPKGRVVEDPRQKLMKRLIPILFIGFGGAIFWSVRSKLPSCKGAENSTAEVEQTTARASGGAVVIAWERPAEVAGSVRNPMRTHVEAAVETQVVPESVGEEASALPRLELKGIVYSADDPSAIVEKQIVHAGDMVGGVRVVAITETSVEFEKDGHRWLQELGQ